MGHQAVIHPMHYIAACSQFEVSVTSSAVMACSKMIEDFLDMMEDMMEDVRHNRKQLIM